MIETERLVLRHWQETDKAPFAELNADVEVMRYFPSPLSRLESDAMIDKITNFINANSYGFWALSLKQTDEFIGMVGLNEIEFNETIPDTPFVEIGWRLAKPYWGNGYACEAAKASLDYAFNELKLETVYAFTAIVNEPSWRLMEKFGMQNTHQDFNHPKLEKGHALERHCLYKITQIAYLDRINNEH